MSTPATRIQSASPSIVIQTDSGKEIRLRYPLSVVMDSDIDPFDPENVFGGRPFGIKRAIKFLADGVVPEQRAEWTAEAIAADVDPAMALRVASKLIMQLAADVQQATGGGDAEVHPTMPVQ